MGKGFLGPDSTTFSVSVSSSILAQSHTKARLLTL